MTTVSSKKRILIIGKLPPPYMGPAVATQILLESDLKNRFELIHFNNTINKTINTQGKVDLFKVFRSFGLYVGFLRLVRSSKPDLILIPISQTTIGFWKDAAYIGIAKWFGEKVLIQLRGSNLRSWLASSSSITRWFFARTIKDTHGVIVLGEKLRYLFEDYFPNEHIYVAPNGGDYQFPSAQPNGIRLSVLYLANLYESKGVRVALDAALRVDSAKFQFRFAGGWRDDQAFKDRFLADVAASTADIEVRKPVSGEEKLALFAQAEVFIFPPIMPEGHPWVLVEAMAAGLPIIATDQGAITESVIDGKNGFIVEAGKPELIVEKLRFLEENPDERKRMAAASRALYERRFTGEKLADNYTGIFHSVIGQD